MADAPPNPCDENEPQEKADHRMHVDPKRLSPFWPVIVQQSQDADNDHEYEHRPMKRDGAGPITPGGA
jgi:hypothetical protein